MDLARKRRGLTRRALAEAVGISARMITAYERGEKEPSAGTLTRLADHLDFAEAFFYGEDLQTVTIDGSSFRAATKMTAKQRDQALASGTLALALSDWIEARFELPDIAVPQYQGVDPETAAEGVRAEWGLGEQPVANMLHLLEAHGVRVFSLVEECREMDAFSFWHGDSAYALTNTTKSAERRRMDLAHELGHLVLHWRGGASGRIAELEADRFGSALLMPRGSVLAYAPGRSPTADDLAEAKQQWGVSVAALAYRMHILGLVTDWHHRSLFIELGRRGWRTAEPYETQHETSRLLETVFKLMRGRGESMLDIASDLAVPPDELNGLVFKLVMAPTPPSSWPSRTIERARSKRPPDLKLL